MRRQAARQIDAAPIEEPAIRSQCDEDRRILMLGNARSCGWRVCRDGHV
jgi:hypothetical protein